MSRPGSVIDDRGASPEQRLRRRLAAEGAWVRYPVFLAEAPGRLDVMGGIADYMGSRVCQWPLGCGTAAAVWSLESPELVIAGNGPYGECRISVSGLMAQSAEGLAGLLDGDLTWARYPAGCLWWLLKHQAARLETGIGMMIQSDVPPGAGVSSSAALEVSVLGALTGLLGLRLTALEVADIGRKVENQIVGAPCGIMDQVAVSAGLADHFLVLLCRPDNEGRPAVIESFQKLPAGLALTGVHSGVAHAVSGDPYTRTRTAAFMAMAILNRCPGVAKMDYLTERDPEVFDGRLSAMIPEYLEGRAFLAEYGRTADTATVVREAERYGLRRAATHHVHEMARVTRFVRLMKTAAAQPAEIGDGAGVRTEVEKAAAEAGWLMNQSHDSYGRFAGLGHAATDLLAEQIRSVGVDGGVFGAKITGGGCGGTVAVLHRDDAATRQSVVDAAGRYAALSGNPVSFFHGSDNGLARGRIRRLDGPDGAPCILPPLALIDEEKGSEL